MPGRLQEEIITVNRQQAEEHFHRDITYPITAEGICELCDNMIRFTAEDREWISKHIPPGVYETPEQAIRAVEWSRN
ncbi:MAG TPA: hypothetical protein VMH22_05530 [bacterium]|nr:hypothetical protein [bacterium]